MMSMKTKNYTDDFCKQMVALHKNGKTVKELSTEYEVPKSTIRQWINDNNNSGSFKAKDNRSEIENKLLELEKENKYLRMENDILRQATLIMGNKKNENYFRE